MEVEWRGRRRGCGSGCEKEEVRRRMRRREVEE